MSNLRVLIVDDNVSLADTVADILAGEGFEVDVASCGVDALIAWRSHPAELVIVDVDLPDIGGMRIARRLARRGNCSLVVMTAHDPADMLPQVKELGAELLSKPFSPSRLLTAIRGVVEERARPTRPPRTRPARRRLLASRRPKALIQHLRQRQ